MGWVGGGGSGLLTWIRNPRFHADDGADWLTQIQIDKLPRRKKGWGEGVASIYLVRAVRIGH